MAQDSNLATEEKPVKAEEGELKLLCAESELLPGDEAGLHILCRISNSLSVFFSWISGLFDILFHSYILETGK